MRHFEFWHPRVFELPYYLYLLSMCARYRLPIRHLAKANYALDHGELGLGSKYSTQMEFDQTHFLPTLLLKHSAGAATLKGQLREFASEHGYPLILKPDNGAVGKGIVKLKNYSTAETAVERLHGDYLLQSFTPHPDEYGVFYVRQNGIGRITGINKKHFPCVVGNGQATLQQLAIAHPRYSPNWQLFLRYLDTEEVLATDIERTLSFIGSHTMGCMFTDDTDLLTPQLERAICAVCDSQPGFNFGRLDIKTENQSAFQRGDITVIEVNGIASLPTHMFDPNNSLRRAYQIFLEHGKLLAAIANEQRQQPMVLKSYTELIRLAQGNAQLLNRMHAQALEG